MTDNPNEFDPTARPIEDELAAIAAEVPPEDWAKLDTPPDQRISEAARAAAEKLMRPFPREADHERDEWLEERDGLGAIIQQAIDTAKAEVVQSIYCEVHLDEAPAGPCPCCAAVEIERLTEAAKGAIDDYERWVNYNWCNEENDCFPDCCECAERGLYEAIVKLHQLVGGPPMSPTRTRMTLHEVELSHWARHASLSEKDAEIERLKRQLAEARQAALHKGADEIEVLCECRGDGACAVCAGVADLRRMADTPTTEQPHPMLCVAHGGSPACEESNRRHGFGCPRCKGADTPQQEGG